MGKVEKEIGENRFSFFQLSLSFSISISTASHETPLFPAALPPESPCGLRIVTFPAIFVFFFLSLVSPALMPPRPSLATTPTTTTRSPLPTSWSPARPSPRTPSPPPASPSLWWPAASPSWPSCRSGTSTTGTGSRPRDSRPSPSPAPMPSLRRAEMTSRCGVHPFVCLFD